MNASTAASAYFERIDEHRYRPTVHSGGAWVAHELHFSPLGGLIVHAIERHLVGRADAGLALSRLSFDILGRLADDVCEIHVETTRPGRTIELVQATLSIGDRAAIVARAWLLASSDTRAVAGGAAEALPAPTTLDAWSLDSVWSGGFINSIDFRLVAPSRPGRATAWLTSPLDLVAGETASDLARFVALVDTANGIATRQPPGEWLYPNVDLTIHFHRQPQGRWVGLDTTVVFGPTGQGVTSTVLHDASGPVGFAAQMLTVRAIETP